jgi:hypothetical protein
MTFKQTKLKELKEILRNVDDEGRADYSDEEILSFLSSTIDEAYQKGKKDELSNLVDLQLDIHKRKLPSISDITGSNQAAKRAITPRGFAEAFYKANK